MYGAVNNVDCSPQISSHPEQLWIPAEQEDHMITK